MSHSYKHSISDFSIGSVVDALVGVFSDFHLFDDLELDMEVELDLDQSDIDADLGYVKRS